MASEWKTNVNGATCANIAEFATVVSLDTEWWFFGGMTYKHNTADSLAAAKLAALDAAEAMARKILEDVKGLRETKAESNLE